MTSESFIFVSTSDRRVEMTCKRDTTSGPICGNSTKKNKGLLAQFWEFSRKIFTFSRNFFQIIIFRWNS